MRVSPLLLVAALCGFLWGCVERRETITVAATLS